ncbi:translocator protein [Culex quinquefasciatus]|uniref:Translocator protein n=1 Tax=Culex quinquefasciatus TaxID=7176 RepID=B0WCI0_CULQU|nr:translocator protein [Culex quinquefasciatus]|eukprot:XP_001846414.1 translocator protein [Culex quinquefasciatus]
MSAEFPKIAAAIALPQVGALVNTYLILPEVRGWYQRLVCKLFLPMDFAFPLAWSTLHAGAGYASYLVWKDGGGFSGSAKGPLILYGTQLTLNWAWTLIFFKLRSFKWSFVESLAAVVATGATGFAFSKVNKIAGYLFIPYFAGCLYFSMLNFDFYHTKQERNLFGRATVEEIKEE